jgi:DNA-binding IclR family transcriptional regulator
MPIGEFERRLDDSILVAPRLHDLVDEGLVSRQGDRYRPSPRGIALAYAFIAWRRVLRAGTGG